MSAIPEGVPQGKASSVAEMSFIPQELVSVPVGRLSIKLYPMVQGTWAVHERAHAYQVNISALRSAPIDTRTMLDTLGGQLSSSTTVDGHIEDWLEYFRGHWIDFTKLELMTFHNSNGDVINDTTIAADPTILKPVQNGLLANCRSSDVRFVRLQIALDFADLVTLDPPGNTILRHSYYLELPQTTQAMVNGGGAAYNLTTFHGDDDIKIMLPEAIVTDILEHTLQDGPISLQDSDFNLNHANIDTEDIRIQIEKKILKLSSAQIFKSVFDTICPGYSEQPHAAVEHIVQSYRNGEGTLVTTTVFDYYQRLMRAARPFATQQTFPISLVNKFMDGIDDRLRPKFRSLFPTYSIQQDRSGRNQRKTLPVALAAAQQAEDEIRSVQEIARGAIGQTFVSNVVGAYPAAAAQAFPSQAEQTLNRYQSDGESVDSRSTATNRSKGTPECFGCGEPHPWMRKLSNGEHKIVCPNKDRPGVRERAEREYKAFIDRLSKKRKAKNDKKRKSSDFAKMSSSDRDKMRRQVLAFDAIDAANDDSSVASSVTTHTNASRRASQSPLILIVSVDVFNAQTPQLSVIPVPIQTLFPHVNLQLGPTVGCANCPMLRCVIDTAAALTTGNFHFFAKVAKSFPHCVAKIYTPKDYSPILLSGIVQRGGESVTTELNVAFLFHLPYETTDGNKCSLLVATGPHVTVNAILGLPFIQSTKMIIDTADQVAELRALECPPFPIDFRRATCHVPQLDETSVPVNAQFADIIKEVENLETYIAQVCAAPIVDPQVRHVRFGASYPSSSVSSTVPSALRSPGATDTSVNLAIQPHQQFAAMQGQLPPSMPTDSLVQYRDPSMGDIQLDRL